MNRQGNVTAIVAAYQRVEQTLATLQQLHSCHPCAKQILVHVDGNQMRCEAAIREAFPHIRVLRSESCIGPGGARNMLIAASNTEFVASFDDDSYPIDNDYFEKVGALYQEYPTASILCAAVYHKGDLITPPLRKAEWVCDFSGGACVYRRSAFVATSGYVPLPVAYGMEEVDLALRLHVQGRRVLKTSWLRVFHNTDLKHHANPTVTANSIENLALLGYLRYPPTLWWITCIQLLNRIQWLARHGRRRGLMRGLIGIPSHLFKHRRYRAPVSVRALRSYLHLRRHPKPA